MADQHEMLERTESFANRDEPIPVLQIPSRDEAATPSSSSEVEQNLRTGGKVQSGTGRIMDKFDEHVHPDMRQSLQDRLFANLMSRIIPQEHQDELLHDGDEAKRQARIDRRSSKYVDRPNFSLFVMNSNFRRFNARIGVVFVLQNRAIHLFAWKHPTATLSFLAIFSLLCLKPHLLPLVPLTGLLLVIMIPSFLARHPISANDPRLAPSFLGPAVAPPSRVKPAPELSRDFMRNMRDLQNSMEDFSRLHDAANEYVTPYTNFSDEGLSSTIFVFAFVACCVSILASALIPWNLILLFCGWSITVVGHPRAQAVILSTRNLKSLRAQFTAAYARLRTWIDADIDLHEPPDVRQVEIFELQKHHPAADTWESWLFSPTPYDPLSPTRIAGARAKGTQFFEDVQPPQGWVWRDKKWVLDLASREWVEQRMITSVQIETEGERWVYDLPHEVVERLEDPSPAKAKAGKKAVGSPPKSGWEEATGLEERGKWRRRRWVRLVERKVIRRGSAKKG